jgi:hypothetical protein
MLKLFGRPTDAEDAKPDLNTRVRPHVRIINGALDESDDSSSGIILNGRIDTATLHFLQPDTAYQRPLGDRADIYAALKDGKIVPNIEVGVRGQDFTTDGDDYLIFSPAYIIDGWQRVGTALRLLDNIPNHPLRIFASLHFGSDEIWERHRFTALNKNIRRISPNLHLRNMRDGNPAITTLFGLSHSDREFVLHKRICWSQSMGREHLMTALNLAKVAMILHSQKGGQGAGTPDSVSIALERMAAAVTLQNFRKNISAFFGIIDDCWPFAAIEYRRSASQTKGTFLMTLARVMSDHPCFWDSDQRIFSMDYEDRKKLAKFAINDPRISELAGSGGQARNILYRLIVDHMNSGRRTNRLKSRFDEE